MKIIWTGYFEYKSTLRGFDLGRIEHIVRYSAEKYSDTATGRRVVGRHNSDLLLIPYEADDESITPITVHVTTRQQINFRIKTGRYTHE